MALAGVPLWVPPGGRNASRQPGGGRVRHRGRRAGLPADGGAADHTLRLVGRGAGAGILCLGAAPAGGHHFGAGPPGVVARPRALSPDSVSVSPLGEPARRRALRWRRFGRGAGGGRAAVAAASRGPRPAARDRARRRPAPRGSRHLRDTAWPGSLPVRLGGDLARADRLDHRVATDAADRRARGDLLGDRGGFRDHLGQARAHADRRTGRHLDRLGAVRGDLGPLSVGLPIAAKHRSVPDARRTDRQPAARRRLSFPAAEAGGATPGQSRPSGPERGSAGWRRCRRRSHGGARLDDSGEASQLAPAWRRRAGRRARLRRPALQPLRRRRVFDLVCAGEEGLHRQPPRSVSAGVSTGSDRRPERGAAVRAAVPALGGSLRVSPGRRTHRRGSTDGGMDLPFSGPRLDGARSVVRAASALTRSDRLLYLCLAWISWTASRTSRALTTGSTLGQTRAILPSGPTRNVTRAVTSAPGFVGGTR